MIRHTVGEWRVTRGAQGDPFSIEGPKGTVAHVKTIVTRSRDRASYVVAHDETEANARLIAEAPEMRAMLERASAFFSISVVEAEDFAAAIATLLARVDGTE